MTEPVLRRARELGILTLVLAGCTPASPLVAGDYWTGAYMCRQGSTRLVLRISSIDGNHVKAIFEFEHRESNVEGAFEATGTYEPKTRGLSFTPGAWIKQPKNYVTVPLEGRISDDDQTYAGRIQAAGCGDFRVSRVAQRKAR